MAASSFQIKTVWSCHRLFSSFPSLGTLQILSQSGLQVEMSCYFRAAFAFVDLVCSCTRGHDVPLLDLRVWVEASLEVARDHRQGNLLGAILLLHQTQTIGDC